MSSDLEIIEQLASEHSQNSADKLQELERTTSDRSMRKAARKALYRLSQSGIVPVRRRELRSTAVAGANNVRAFASAFDGAGNRLILFLVYDPDGGAATLVQITTSDIEGVHGCQSLKIRLRNLDERINTLKSQLDTGLAVAEIDPDYGRRLLAQSRALTASKSKRSPAELIAWIGKIGEPSGGSAADLSDGVFPPIYSHVTEDDIRNDPSISIDPAELFNLKWFDAWYFAAEDTLPWLQRWEEATLESGDNPDFGAGTKLGEIVFEAADGLMTDAMRTLYVIRLEESADILWLCGKEVEARRALYHAIALRTTETVHLASAPFVYEIALRTLGAALEMVRLYREQRQVG